jgi:hypothetical protein
VIEKERRGRWEAGPRGEHWAGRKDGLRENELGRKEDGPAGRGKRRGRGLEKGKGRDTEFGEVFFNGFLKPFQT